MMLSRFSLGTGDRFAHQGVAQLRALKQAQDAGVEITPVWNKSDREHSIIGSSPGDTRAAADAAVARSSWMGPYFVDADHITMKTASQFIDPCDFFTLDVAGALSRTASANETQAFLRRHPELTDPDSAMAAARLLPAAREAGRIYRFVRERKAGDFVTEVSMDETAASHSPLDLHVFLSALADEGVPVNTVAPRFCGEFHKGVDYEGDIARFEQEFAACVDVLKYAVAEYGLPADLKLSVHSGSDKFSLYAPIRRVLEKTDAGVHIKTAGTTWLEELIGLAEAGGEGLDLAKDIYAPAYARRVELCAPYATVVRIVDARLPHPAEVRRWSAEQFARALRHDPRNQSFNPDFRQLLHVAFRIAVEMGQRFITLLERLRGDRPQRDVQPSRTTHPPIVSWGIMSPFTPVLHSVSYAGAWPGQASLEVDQFLLKAVELGYKSVARVAKRPHVSPLVYDEGARRKLRGRLEELGLDLAAVMGYSDFTAGLDHSGIPSAEMNAAYAGTLAKLTADLGATRLRIFTGYYRPEISYDAQYNEVVKGLRMAGREAARHGVTLAVQNHHDIACHHDQLAWLMEEVDHPNVRVAFDAWAPHLQGVRGEELIRAVEKMGPYLEFTTVADYQAHARFRYDAGVVNYIREEPALLRAVAPGAGEIDYTSFFRGLCNAGYRGPVAYEMCAHLRGGGSIENLDRTARVFPDFLRSVTETP